MLVEIIIGLTKTEKDSDVTMKWLLVWAQNSGSPKSPICDNHQSK